MSTRIFSWGNRWLVGYLTFLSAFAPLSTDMYLPALPHMAEALHTSYAEIALTVSSFLLVFGVSMLFWGPLSDKYGRRPVLLAGSLLYMLSCVGIALAPGYAPLVFWRGVQALGSGALAAMAMAIVKDLLRGSQMERVLAWMQTVMIIAPMLAPVVGSWLLLLVDWRGIFWTLTSCGAIALAGALALRETAYRRTPGGVLGMLSRIPAVLGKGRFARPLLLFSCMAMPFFAYLGVSAHVYQTHYGLSAQAFGLFFAANAFCSMFGPMLHMRLFIAYPRSRVIACHLAGMCLGGGLLVALGSLSPWHFAACYILITFCGSALRPPATVLMMSSIRGDNGVVASLINCGGLLCGSLSMYLATLDVWSSAIVAAGAISCVMPGLAWLVWLRLGREYAA